MRASPALAGLTDYLRRDADAVIANCDRSGVGPRDQQAADRLRGWAAEVERIAGVKVAPQADIKQLLDRFERAAMRKGELWERCQGKGWPDAESDEFTKLRDERCPALRAEIQAALGVKTCPATGNTCRCGCSGECVMKASRNTGVQGTFNDQEGGA